ncbi:hypothetical protein [Duganella phyllosphaerae]|uniref:BioF2-like acetyltransferase domain-containing protein n=1 Tax=Duganella phyllosphaerae TaxID=762836 RepID=A0A1E7X7Y0_9BURK|nr:hypothetical protein [Duganella phyllosphaerae]OFA09253.1 hypothetical protein DUPY_00310 [Duganella phyllosphaerae]
MLVKLPQLIDFTPLVKGCRLVLDVARLPVARLCFDTRYHPEDVRNTYRLFTRRHPRYKVIGHKQFGVALIDLRLLADNAAYPCSGAASYVGKARKRGYRLAQIDRNEYIDAIHAINTSVPNRQGRPMDAHYQQKAARYEPQCHYRYFGVFDKCGQLVAYANMGRFGNFAAFAQLLGYRNNDGVMHLMIADIVNLLLAERRSGDGPDYVMYDTFFGAQPGLRQFKTLLGFTPYRVRYTLQ